MPKNSREFYFKIESLTFSNCCCSLIAEQLLVVTQGALNSRFQQTRVLIILFYCITLDRWYVLPQFPHLQNGPINGIYSVVQRSDKIACIRLWVPYLITWTCCTSHRLKDHGLASSVTSQWSLFPCNDLSTFSVTYSPKFQEQFCLGY